MNVKNLVDATMEALTNDTKTIKGILRQNLYADYIFPSVIDGRVQVSARDLFAQVNATPPVPACPVRWIANYDDALSNILLHRAAQLSDYELIQFLVEKGADVTSTDKLKKTALHIACITGSFDVIKFLIQKSPAYILDLRDDNENTPLELACRHNCPEVVQLLLSQVSSVAAQDDEEHLLLEAACRDVAEHATRLISIVAHFGVRLDRIRGYMGSPLMAAIKLHTIRKQPAANRSTSQNSPYIVLCMMLIAHGCDVNAVNDDGVTALHLAACVAGLENVVRKLLISGSDIDRRDSLGLTPLYYACKYGSQTIVDLLIISGANLRALDREATLEKWRRSKKLNEKNTQLLNYVVEESKQCLSLENLCNITLRKNIRHVEKDAIHLGLPPLLVKRLLLEE